MDPRREFITGSRPEFVELDGRSFAVRHLQDGPRLLVERPTGDLLLDPWTLDDHLAALDRHAFLEGHVPRVDLAGLAREILDRSHGAELDDLARAELAPLALWWAYGPPPSVPADIPPGLRPWTSLERARALDACTDPHTRELRAGSFLRALLLASTPDGPDHLARSGPDALALLDALTQLNAPLQDMSDGPGSSELARTTLRLCGALGWTPSQVWSTPAPEIDHLLALLTRLEKPARTPAPPRPAPSPSPAPAHAYSRLAAFPDAVIIELNPG